MAIRVISRDSILEERRARVAAGTLEPVEHAEWPVQTVQELITSSDITAADFVQNKVEIDVSEGRAENPTLFDPLYTIRRDVNFPELVPTNIANPRWGIMFFDHQEGGEIHFGTLAKGARGNIPIREAAAGIQYTQRMIDFNYLSQIEDSNLDFGRAWNAMLNHKAFGPLLTFTYPAANITAADATAGVTYQERIRNTLRAAQRHAKMALAADGTPKSRAWNYLLCHPTDTADIRDALAYRTGANLNPLASVDDFTIIEYEGWSTTLNYGTVNKVFSYPGVTPKTCYGIRAGTGLIFLEKLDLAFAQDNADLSRLIAKQIVGRGLHGFLADVSATAERMTLPAS